MKTKSPSIFSNNVSDAASMKSDDNLSSDNESVSDMSVTTDQSNNIIVSDFLKTPLPPPIILPLISWCKAAELKTHGNFN